MSQNLGALDLPYSLVADIPLVAMNSTHPAMVTRFCRKADGRDLYFIGTNHCNNIDSQTHKTVKAAIALYQPDLLIIEGLQSHMSEGALAQAAVLARHMVASARNTARQQPAEQTYAMYLAARDRIEFMGGEPPMPTVKSELFSFGYSIKDFMAFRLISAIVSAKRDNTIATFDATCNLRNIARAINIANSDALTYQAFHHDYETRSDRLNKRLDSVLNVSLR